MKLEEIIRVANRGWVTDNDVPLADSEDALAKFIVGELHDTFDEDAADEDQLFQAMRAIESARADLENVYTDLMRKRAIVMAEERNKRQCRCKR